MPKARESSVELDTPLASPDSRGDFDGAPAGGSSVDLTASASERAPCAEVCEATAQPSGRVRMPRKMRNRYLPTYKVVLLGDPAVGKSQLMSRFASGTFDPYSRATIGVEFVAREVDLSCQAPTFGGNFDVPEVSSTNVSGYQSPASSQSASENVTPRAAALAAGGSTHPPPSDGVGSLQRTASMTSSSQAASNEHVMLQLWDTAGQEIHSSLTSHYYRGSRGVAVVYDVTRRATLHNVGRWVASARERCDDDCVIVVIGNKTDLRHTVEVSEDEAREFCHTLGCRHFLASAMSGEGVEFAFLQLLLAVHAEAVVKGVANQLPNGVDVVRQAGGAHAGMSTIDSGPEGIAGFRLHRPKPAQSAVRRKCC